MYLSDILINYSVFQGITLFIILLFLHSAIYEHLNLLIFVSYKNFNQYHPWHCFHASPSVEHTGATGHGGLSDPSISLASNVGPGQSKQWSATWRKSSKKSTC